MATAALTTSEISYLTATEAAEIDDMLMGSMGYSLDQLMELAGLSVATATADAYKLPDAKRILIVCGPGNNGGDGLVAARHLHHFGYQVEVCYPKATQKPIYQGLVTQLGGLDIPISQTLPETLSSFDVIIDAIFGFSFAGDVRAPFDTILPALKLSRVPIVSVDIPSGWDVNAGNAAGLGVEPSVLISLTAPKHCARNFSGIHYLGGRFVPPAIQQQYSLVLPSFAGTDMHVKIS
eukprot:CAMPEP_0179467854 /NCGR_PEP_ID=MMETSP0799-20121207/48892_1 /TAXON_ID=46947 /ORGANISM="Geminigera cryophila, Strain CCMP2564" /LENGTH=235 /DNA_ID=CAMNT_0021273497 /DNA_START=90 /DNA_END=797 /DNA_ORIENTATION=-